MNLDKLDLKELKSLASDCENELQRLALEIRNCKKGILSTRFDRLFKAHSEWKGVEKQHVADLKQWFLVNGDGSLLRVVTEHPYNPSMVATHRTPWLRNRAMIDTVVDDPEYPTLMTDYDERGYGYTKLNDVLMAPNVSKIVRDFVDTPPNSDVDRDLLLEALYGAIHLCRETYVNV